MKDVNADARSIGVSEDVNLMLRSSTTLKKAEDGDEDAENDRHPDETVCDVAKHNAIVSTKGMNHLSGDGVF